MLQSQGSPQILCSIAKPVHTPDLKHLLLIFLLLAVTATAGGSSGLLALDTSRAATTVGGGKSEVDVLLGVQADHVGGHVDDLLTDTKFDSVSMIVRISRATGFSYRM